jgi:Ring finger domain
VAYRRERDSLRRLRELRQRHRELVVGYHLSTYSQIPGAIPDSYNFGFIFVPAENPPRPVRPIRELLTPEQRRRILESLLACEPYSSIGHAREDVEASSGPSLLLSPADEKEKQDPANPQLDIAIRSESSEAENGKEPTSIVIPSHETPQDDNTCAICLDAFLDGELISDATECRHYFHKDCLLGWLDQHDVCPCCRRTMVTEQDWKRAMEELQLPEQPSRVVARRR